MKSTIDGNRKRELMVKRCQILASSSHPQKKYFPSPKHLKQIWKCNHTYEKINHCGKLKVKLKENLKLKCWRVICKADIAAETQRWPKNLLWLKADNREPGTHTKIWEVINSAAQQWSSITSVYTLRKNTSSWGFWPSVVPSLHSRSPSFLRAPSPIFSVFVGSSSQTGSSSGLRKMESSVWERVELLSRRVMMPLLNEVPLC